MQTQSISQLAEHAENKHNKDIADEIRYLVDLHDKILPTVLEIPSKDKPFDPNKDSIIQRVKLFFGGDISHL
ncbi:hypothetical protein PFFCH_03017 [Plasmodium falciparum FCH/4]|uniref:Uncharacterized protein n=1 Tax=Plasmodium falciparum FCH/4 TaxID=1036724 RepID=A0A024VMN1_PLAFA|nr:hypothetical protein PFFCH_03017 [Plasmodium falciparum FCH/4]